MQTTRLLRERIGRALLEQADVGRPVGRRRLPRDRHAACASAASSAPTTATGRTARCRRCRPASARRCRCGRAPGTARATARRAAPPAPVMPDHVVAAAEDQHRVEAAAAFELRGRCARRSRRRPTRLTIVEVRMLGRDQPGEARLRRARAGADAGAVADDQQALASAPAARPAAARCAGPARPTARAAKRCRAPRRRTARRRCRRAGGRCEARPWRSLDAAATRTGRPTPAAACRTTLRQPLLCLAISARAVSSSFLPSKPRLFMSATHSSSIACETLMNSCASASLSV